MKHTETWRPVVGFEGLYEVSDQGRVRSLDRIGRGKRGAPHGFAGRILRCGETADGYYRATLFRDGLRLRRTVHQLVLEAFVGPCPDGMEACHNDGDAQNNAAGNLRWDTHAANIRDKREHGTDHHASRDACGRGHAYVSGSFRVWRGARRCKECDRIRAATVRAARGRRALSAF